MVTSKEQEREALKKIQQIINSLGADSYIAAAFDGCIEMAEDNINDDFANSYKGIAEAAQKREREANEVIKSQDKVIKDLESERDNFKKLYEHEKEAYQRAADDLHQRASDNAMLSEKIEYLENELEKPKLEIMKLKANIYDLMMAGGTA